MYLDDTVYVHLRSQLRRLASPPKLQFHSWALTNILHRTDTNFSRNRRYAAQTNSRKKFLEIQKFWWLFWTVPWAHSRLGILSAVLQNFHFFQDLWELTLHRSDEILLQHLWQLVHITSKNRIISNGSFGAQFQTTFWSPVDSGVISGVLSGVSEL